MGDRLLAREDAAKALRGRTGMDGDCCRGVARSARAGPSCGGVHVQRRSNLLTCSGGIGPRSAAELFPGVYPCCAGNAPSTTRHVRVASGRPLGARACCDFSHLLLPGREALAYVRSHVLPWPRPSR